MANISVAENKNLTNTEQKALKIFKEKIIRKFGDSVVLIKLYGSKARGDSHQDSDIDVLLVFKNDSIQNSTKETIAEIVFDILLELNVYISAATFSFREYNYLNNPPIPFMYWIQKEGINL